MAYGNVYPSSHRGNVSPLKDGSPSRAFSFFVCLSPFRQGGEVLFFLSVPCRCPAISAFYQKKKGKDFQDITAQKLPLTARNTPRRSIMAIWTRRHWRAGRATRKKRHSSPLAPPLPSPVPRGDMVIYYTLHRVSPLTDELYLLGFSVLFSSDYLYMINQHFLLHDNH